MNVRLRVVALCLAVLFTAHAEVTVKKGAYHDLVVSFSPNVNATNGETIVESLENLFTETSAVLQKAIGLRIAGVTFHLPSTWDTSKWENKTVADAPVQPQDQRDLVVDDTVDSAFGTLPTTLQYGGCGVPGRRLTVPVGFLNENTEEDFPKGQLLAREWLKFRYGVFDENGFDGDDMYPLYYNIPGTTEARITECTDPEVEYYFRDTDGNNCSLEIPFASSSKCEIHPKEISQNTTSSLMYYHKKLTNMINVCGKEHNHTDSTPSKQNVLCSGQSIWEILEKSGDFNETKAEDLQSEDEEVKFSYRQEVKPRVVLAFENSDNLHDEKDIVTFAIRRFFYSLPDGSEFGLYSFNKDFSEIRVLSHLEKNREVVVNAAFTYNKPDICHSCALDKAVEALSGKTQVTNQNTIILITGSNSTEINDALFDKYKDVCLKIVIFRRVEDSVVDYDGIISSPGCHSISIIQTEFPISLIFTELYKSLQESITLSPTDTKVSQVEAGVISYASSFKFDTHSTAAKYTLWTNQLIELDGINCAKSDGSRIKLAYGVETNNIASFNFDSVDDTIEVNCKLEYPKALDALVQVEMTSKPGEYIDGEVWVDDPSNGEQMPVILYAKINYGSYPVQDATVTARVITNGTVHKLQLLDNGRGDPDITEGDGIYSRYFVDLSSEGEYIVLLTVSDNYGTSQVGRKGQNPCCGSKVKSTPENAGFFIKSFKTSFHAKQKPDNGFKPSRVFDLRVTAFDPQNFIILNWTAPGGETDKGNASSYVIRYFTSRDAIKNDFNNGTLLENSLEPNFHGSEETLEIKLDNFERSKHYYVAIKSLNILKQESDLSNVLEFFLPEDDATKIDEETTTDPSVTKKSMSDKKVIGIFIGVLVLVIVLIVAVYLFVHFFVIKPRRKREAANKENGGINRNATSPPISLNSIPADVILKHHNEVVSAKSQHKDPPIFKEENLESIDLAAETDGANGSDQRNNVEYSTVQKRQPEPGSHRSLERENALSPKRMTNV